MVQAVNGQSFSTSYLVGTCWRAGTDTSGTKNCDTTKETGDVQYFRIVVAVSWSDDACAANTCYFTTAILLTGLTDPTFNFNSTPPTPPTLSGCTGQAAVVGDTLNLPVIKQQDSDTAWACALSGGVPPFTWSASGLPPGILLDQTGHFVGTLTTAGTFSAAKVTVTDAFLRSNTSSTFTWTVNPGVTIAGTPPSASLVNTTMTTATLTASGGLGTPYTWSATGLPPGVAFAKSTNTQAQFTGKPTTAGTYTVRVTATDAASTHAVTTTYTWNVYNALSPTNPGNETSTVNTAITPLPLPVSGGSGGYTVTISAGSSRPGLA